MAGPQRAVGRVRLATRCGLGAAAVALGLAGLPVQAATFSSEILAALPASSAAATFRTRDAPDTVLTVTESGSATMQGSVFGYEGLWLGADNTGGQYTFAFSTPIESVSFSFVALSRDDSGDEPMFESLGRIFIAADTSATLVSPDETASWDPLSGTLTPEDGEGSGVLTFSVNGAASFSSIRFDHLQPYELNGFVINQIDFTAAAAVPEPSSTVLLALGLVVVAASARRHLR